MNDNTESHSKERIQGYIEALEDSGLDLSKPANPKYDEILQTCIDNGEIDNEGTWFVRFYQNWGTHKCEERFRVTIKNGEIIAGIVGEDKQIKNYPIGPEASLADFVGPIKKKVPLVYGMNTPGSARRRIDGQESADADEE